MDKKYIRRDTRCFLHDGQIKDGIALYVILVYALTVCQKIVNFVIEIYVITRRY